MKYRILVIALTVVLLLSGCGVSQADYDTLREENEQLALENSQQKEEIDSLKTELTKTENKNKTLTDQFNQSQVNVLLLRQNLAATYDGYRYLIIDVTNQVYSDGLSKSEWETILTTRTAEIPTYDDVVKLMKD